MAFNQLVKKSFVPNGATQAFAAPFAAYRGALVALNGVTSGTTTPAPSNGLVIAFAGQGSGDVNIEWESIAVNVQAVLTTAAITAAIVWQVSNDMTNWITMGRLTNTAYQVFAPAGAGTTNWVQYLQGYNGGYPYLRPAVLSGGATGGASDNVVISFNARKRQTAA